VGSGTDEANGSRDRSERGWGLWLDADGTEGIGPRWWYHHKGEPQSFSEDHARAMADTLNRGAMSGRCEARKLP
jgi:hypothetical protein